LPLPTIDPVIVVRSARANPVYGDDFTYGHYVRIRRPWIAAGVFAGAGGLIAAAQFAPLRRLLGSLRPSGAGPDAETRAQSWFRVTLTGISGGHRVVCEVAGGDPGYDETAKMLAESALCLARDRKDLPKVFGTLTPATAFGPRLIPRLQAAGITFSTVDAASS